MIDWIDVNDRMPNVPSRDMFLITLGGYAVGWWTGTEWMVDGKPSTWLVTHWFDPLGQSKSETR